MQLLNNNFEITEAVQIDTSGIAQLFKDYHKFYRKDSTLQECGSYLEERLKNNDSKIFVAKQRNKVIGFTQLYPSFSSVTMKKIWILNDLFVDRDYRKQGVAKGLLQEAENFSRKSKARGLNLKTEITNFAAQNLYEGRGWVKDEVFYSYYLNHS